MASLLLWKLSKKAVRSFIQTSHRYVKEEGRHSSKLSATNKRVLLLETYNGEKLAEKLCQDLDLLNGN